MQALCRHWGVWLVMALLLAGGAGASRPVKLTIQSMPPGATVVLDGKELSLETPLRINTSPGLHSLTLEMPGYKTVSRKVEVYSGIGFASFHLEPLSISKTEEGRDSSTSARSSARPDPGPRAAPATPTEKIKAAPQNPSPPLPRAPAKVSETPAKPSDQGTASFSGPVKVIHRSQESAPETGRSWYLLPRDNPFSNWLRSRDKQAIKEKNDGNEEAKKSSPDDEKTIEVAHLHAGEEQTFPLVIKEPPGSQEEMEKTPDAELKPPEPKAPAPEAQQGPEEQEPAKATVQVAVTGQEGPLPAPAQPPAPEVEWPDSAEETMYQAAAKLPRFPEKFNVLLLGLDRRDRRGILATGAEIPLDVLRKRRANSDVIMVVQLDFIDRQVRMVSIPRDTRVRIPGWRGYRKINAAYAYGREKKARQVVENFLDITIHRTVVADWRSAKKSISVFKKLGLDYNGFSEKEMFWHLRKRSFRRGDFRRIERQQRFLRYAAGEYLRLYNETRAARGTAAAVKRGVLEMAVKQGLSFVETDLAYEEIKLLTYAFRDYETRQTTMAQVRGRGQLVGKSEDSEGVYLFKPFRHHSFDDIIARAEG